jgi:hypothetical protein
MTSALDVLAPIGPVLSTIYLVLSSFVYHTAWVIGRLSVQLYTMASHSGPVILRVLNVLTTPLYLIYRVLVLVLTPVAFLLSPLWVIARASSNATLWVVDLIARLKVSGSW